MIENTNTKQFYPGPILNDTLEITDFLFNDVGQIKIKHSKLNEEGILIDVDLVYPTDYEVVKVLPSDINAAEAALTASTGQIILKTVNVLPGEKLTVYRVSQIIQDKDYPRTGAFPAATHEGALDYLTMQNQEQKDDIDRALKVPISTQNFEGSLPLPIPSRALKINNDGTGFEMSEYDPDLALITTEEFKNRAEQAAASAEQAAASAETDATLASEKANLAVQEAEKATSQANLTQQYKQETIDYIEEAYNVIDTNITEGVESLNQITKEGLDEIFSSLQGQTMPIGYPYSLNCAADYIPSGSLPRDGAEYTKEQFPSLWENYLAYNMEYLDWTTQTVGSRSYNAITYGDGLFVAVGDYGQISTSTNGTNWTTQTVGSDAYNAITYANNKFMAVGSGAAILTSPDGTNWTTQTVGDEHYRAIIYGDGTFVAVGASSTISTSPDGTNWTTQTVGSGSFHYNAITYADNKFVAVGASGTISTSTDGIDWTTQTVGIDSFHYNAITYADNKFVAVGALGAISISTDGTNWTTQTVGSRSYKAITYGDGLFVAVGDYGQISTSTNGTNWTTQTVGDEHYRAIIYADDMFIIVGDYGQISTSTDGIDWTIQTVENGYYKEITYANNMYVVVGTAGQILTRKKLITGTMLSLKSYADYETEVTNFGACESFAIDIERETFKVPTAKSIERFLIKKKEPTEGDISWYNIYSDGYCEQGGYDKVESKTVTVTLPIAYKDKYSYTITEAIGGVDNTAANNAYSNVYAPVDGSTFTIKKYATGTGYASTWETKGYIDLAAYELPRQFVVVANGSINQSQMDWAEWASSLNGKANADLSNCTKPHIVEVSDKSLLPSWYRVYSDGWCEQGGLRSYVADSASVSLLKTYQDTSYFVSLTDVDRNDTGGADALSVLASKTISNFVISTASIADGGILWEAKGYIS